MASDRSVDDTNGRSPGVHAKRLAVLLAVAAVLAAAAFLLVSTNRNWFHRNTWPVVCISSGGGYQTCPGGATPTVPHCQDLGSQTWDGSTSERFRCPGPPGL